MTPPDAAATGAPEPCRLCGAALAPGRGFSFGGRRYARCTGCRAHAATPHPDADQLEAFYRDRYYALFGPAEATARRRAMLRRLVAEIPRRPPGRLLDVGCGAGHLLALARDAGWDVAGVDPSAEGCARAAGRYGFRVTASSLEAAGMPDAMFDVVTLVNVLDQAPDPALLLAAARRTLRPGGLLVVRVPNGDFHRAAWRAIRLLPSPVSRRARSLVIFHSLCLGARTLRGLLERNGFRRVRVRNAPLSGSEWSVPGNARGRVALACMAAAARAGATLGTALTGGRIVWAPSLLAYAEREAA